MARGYDLHRFFSNTPIPLKAKDLALEGLSPKTCFRNKRHLKVSLAFTWIYLQNDVSVPLDCKLALGLAICDNHFFPSVCLGSSRTSILPMKKRSMNIIIYMFSEVWSTIPHWPNRQSCTFCSRIGDGNAEHTRNSGFGKPERREKKVSIPENH